VNVPEVLVVGGGVAGCELAWGCARAGLQTQLLSTSLDTLYTLPSDRWRATPPTESLWATLAAEAADPQDREVQRAALLRRGVKRELERIPSLRLTQANVTALRLRDAQVVGVETWEGPVVEAAVVVLAVGSFLEGRLSMGAASEHAGRLSEMAYDDLFLDLQRLGVPFEGAMLSLDGDANTPGYTVAHRRFAAGGLDALELDLPCPAVGALRAASGAWALGACVCACSVAEAAAAGRDLARYFSRMLGGVPG
jgi:hypothetical protein